MLESAIALLSDAGGRRRLVMAGQVALAAALFFMAWSRSVWGLSIGLAVAGAASGVACGAAQALLVASNPQETDRAMVRWTLFAQIGDVITPLAGACAIVVGHSYRVAMAAIAAIVAVQCVVMALHSREPSTAAALAATFPPEPLRAALAHAVRRSRLWAWLLAAAMCTLLDELVVAFVALRLERDQGLSEALATAGPVTFCAGSALGAAFTEAAVARLGRRGVLLSSGVLCAVALGGVVLVPLPPFFSSVALFLVGFMSAPHHPLALAHAYDEMPNNPGTVQAVGQLFVVVDVAAPLALGLVADRFGLNAAIACLILQPATIVFCAASLAKVGGD